MIDTYRARRRLQIGDGWREPGEPCPEAHLWRLVEGLVTGGYLDPIQSSEADFVAAVEKYCPDEAATIYEVLSFTPVKQNTPTQRAKSHPPKTVLATAPEKIDKDG
jgi:hypothetical protein